MISEGDLLGRNDTDRLARRDWWLAMLKDGPSLPEALEALIARLAEHVMHAPVLTIESRATLQELAEMLRLNDIKRLPVMQGGCKWESSAAQTWSGAVATVAPQPSRRSAGGLISLFAGMMQSDIRPEDDFAPATRSIPKTVDRPAVTADAFRTLVIVSKQAERDE